MSRRAPARIAGVAAALVLGLALRSRVAAAHDQPYSYLDVRLGGDGLSGRVMAHVADLAHETPGLDADALLRPGEAGRHAAALTRTLDARFALDADGHAVHPAWGRFAVVPDRKLLAVEWRAPAASSPAVIRVRGPLFAYDPLHETYLNVYRDGRLAREDLLDATHRSMTFTTGARQSWGAVARTFVLQGIHHIFIGPDHILFIVGLLLLGGGIGRLLKIVTAFTLAHSITLALATLAVLSPSPRITEPGIALSIVFVGTENLLALRNGRDVRAVLAFGFGLIHGFGFASVLRAFGLPREALALSLVSFNVGVEIGQMCIVLAVVPLLARVRARAPRIAQRIVLAGSACVILAGGYWFVERVFFPA